MIVDYYEDYVCLGSKKWKIEYRVTEELRDKGKIVKPSMCVRYAKLNSTDLIKVGEDPKTGKIKVTDERCFIAWVENEEGKSQGWRIKFPLKGQIVDIYASKYMRCVRVGNPFVSAYPFLSNAWLDASCVSEDGSKVALQVWERAGLKNENTYAIYVYDVHSRTKIGEVKYTGGAFGKLRFLPTKMVGDQIFLLGCDDDLWLIGLEKNIKYPEGKGQRFYRILYGDSFGKSGLHRIVNFWMIDTGSESICVQAKRNWSPHLELCFRREGNCLK